MDHDRRDLAAALGERFAGFKPLGKGGHGAVFAVWDRVRKIDLALKVMRDAGDPSLPERFEREYQILAAARSRNLVTVHDHGQQRIRLTSGQIQNHFWYSMERCDSSVRRSYQRMSLGQRIDVVMQMLDGLAFLHAKEIAHRDIKPDNLFLVTTPQGTRVKIGDFGIATVARLAPNTVDDTISGSPPYLAPERWSGDQSADWRPSDQYAAGVTLFEILSGGVLPLDFSGGYMRGHERSGIRSLAIPELRGRRVPVVDRVIAPMLAKRPEQRYADMGTCKRELAAALAQEGVG
ncbi:MAG: serine/threonine-protein kinase [Minicystis sp.]